MTQSSSHPSSFLAAPVPSSLAGMPYLDNHRKWLRRDGKSDQDCSFTQKIRLMAMT